MKDLDIFNSRFNSIVPQVTYGLERMFGDMNRLFTTSVTQYPPLNIYKESDNLFVLELAVAGFDEHEIEVLEDRMNHKLTISGKKVVSEEDSDKYLWQGIAARNFSRSLFMQENDRVESATLNNGMLTIKVARVIPEELLPRSVEINKPALEAPKAAKVKKAA